MAFDYSCLDYKKAIRRQVAALQSLGQPLTYSTIARNTKVQKTYLSKVLNNHTSHFSRDQLFAVCCEIQLIDDEVDFCLMLHDYQTTSSDRRRATLQKKLKSVQNRHLSTSAKLNTHGSIPNENKDLVQYYLDPDATLLHMLLSIERYAKDINQASQALGLSQERTSDLMELLQRAGLIEWDTTKRRAKILVADRHLDKFHYLTDAHQSLMKARCLERSSRVARTNRLNFVVTFTADEATFNDFRSRIIDLLEEIKAKVQSAPCKNLFQFNLDLFPWTT